MKEPPENQAFKILEAVLSGQPGLIHTAPANEATGKLAGEFIVSLHQTILEYLKTLPR